MFHELSRRRVMEGVGWWRIVMRRLIFPLLPEWIRQAYFRCRKWPGSDRMAESFIYSANYSTEGGGNRVGIKRRWWEKTFDPRTEIVEAIANGYFSMPLEIVEADAEIIGCRYNMPFLDKRIIEFCLSLPGEEFIKEDIPRIFIRNAMRGVLPEEIRMRRDKCLFGATDVEMLLANKELFEEVVDTESDLAWGILDRKSMRAAYSVLSGLPVTGQRAIRLGHQLSKYLNVAAFLQWMEKIEE